MKKSELKQIIKEEIKNVFENEDPMQSAFNKAMKKAGVELYKGPNLNKIKEVKPTGEIKIMNINYDEGVNRNQVVVDINDDIYKDEDERALRTTFPESELEYSSTSDVEQYIRNNRDELKWKVVHA